jgi:ATP-dependent Lon protease
MDNKKKNKYHKSVNYLNNKIISLNNHLDDLYKYKIIVQDFYNERMTLLDDVSNKINDLEEYLNDIKYKNKNKAEKMIDDINILLQKISLKIGSNNLSNLLDIYIDYNNFISDKDKTYIELFNLYNNFYYPLSCGKITDIDKLFKKNNIESIDLPKVIKLIDTNKTNILNEKINGATILFQLEDGYIFYVNGYFKKDCIQYFKNFPYFKNKLIELENLAETIDAPIFFKEKYIEQISLKDFILLSCSELYELIKNDYNDFIGYKTKTLSILIKEFIKSPVEKQRKILLLFLISSEEDQFTAHIIFDLIKDKPFLNESQNLSEMIYLSLHWKIQKVFKITKDNFEISKNKLESLTINDIPYETRIFSTKTSDSIKSKAMEKLKEINGSKDNSTKAQQWLDGFLKIPFGLYKKEPIINFLKSYEIKIDKFIDVFTIRIAEYITDDLNNDNNKIYDTLIQIIDEYHSTIYKSENFYSLFVKYIENTKNKLINNINNIEFKYDKNNDIDDYNKDFLKYIKKVFIDIDILVNDWNEFKVKKEEYIKKVDSILDKCTYGQGDAKKQMKRIIGQWMNGNSKGQCFGLCGPPGVGKTTLCKNGLAKCLFDQNEEPRPFAFLPLGGATNGSILEGHHYTYLGSTWGKIVDILIETKCMNPIIYIDELDKISKTEHGREIISILTHITDQSQNKEFYDRYFSSIPIDLSQILFIFSYNDRDNIDRILRDRIQEINIKPLSNNEKLIISKNYICPEIFNNIGFSTSEIIMSNEIIIKIIDEYTYEAGVRKLNEIFYDIIRELNLKKIMGHEINYPIEITEKLITDILSNTTQISIKKIYDKSMVGLVNGLYATNSGLGGLTIIQVMKTISDKKLALEKLTGNQGDVMKESMNCALTLAWNILPIDIKETLNKDGYGLHIHCPESATPKDGPSAGLAITTAIISRLINIPIKNTVAMTGEVDLLGNAHEIGGLYSKLQGALQAGVKTVLIPRNNLKDLDIIFNKELEEKNEIKKSKSIKNLDSYLLLEHNSYKIENNKYAFRNSLDIYLVDNIFDVLKYSLADNDIVFNMNF